MYKIRHFWSHCWSIGQTSHESNEETNSHSVYGLRPDGLLQSWWWSSTNFTHPCHIRVSLKILIFPCISPKMVLVNQRMISFHPNHLYRIILTGGGNHLTNYRLAVKLGLNFWLLHPLIGHSDFVLLWFGKLLQPLMKKLQFLCNKCCDFHKLT